MAGGKETTRQKMINIMYLVLIAMLALNVSDSVLNAFKNLNDGLTETKTTVGNGVDQLFTQFENGKLKDEPARAKPIHDTAVMAKQYVDNLNAYVQKLKDDFKTEGGDIDPDTKDVTKRSDMDIATRVMINEGKGKELKSMINQTRQNLISLLPENERNSVTFSLEAKDHDDMTWEAANFGDGTPLTAAITQLTKIQADSKNAESEVVKKIFGKMDKAQITLDSFGAVAVAPSSYVLQGNPYTAEVFLTAYDSKSNPTIDIDGTILHVEQGKGKYVGNTSTEGVHTWKGIITVKGTDGVDKKYPLAPQTYTVSKPSAVVSLDKMNVMYIGIPNPLSVSAPGMDKDHVKASMEGGSLSEVSPGHYNATVSSIGTATVNVVGVLAGGKSQVLGSTLYRIKRIPPPKAQFATKTGGTTSAANIKAQDRLFAKLDNFEYDAKFNIRSFTLMIIKPRQDVIIKDASGPSLTADMHNAMNSVAPGTTVVFKNIIVVGPDGVQQEIDPITLSAN